MERKPHFNPVVLLILYTIRFSAACTCTLQRKSKKDAMAITSSILDRFAKFFHCCKEH